MVAPSAEAWAQTIYWRCMANQLAEVHKPRAVPEWLKMLLLGSAGGLMIGLLLGVGLLCC